MGKLVVNDMLIESEIDIRREVTRFYKQLYNNGVEPNVDERFLNNMFTVEDVCAQTIAAPITMAEMWEALRSVRATTPGPDGISNFYLKKLWDIMGPVILEAWQYSIQINELCPSHKTSLLRLIPKPGKDTLQLKNWRPITLSNCDHKLITRVYNNRILKAISPHITATQTAYIKGRNIADNLRLLGAAVKMAEVDPQLDATVIALDAQKAFDSVQHGYLQQVLERVGLGNFIHLFRLLYKDLKNDIIINGKIGPGYSLGNGVKQGDALSCSLFLLAMEPIIRNIETNEKINAVSSGSLNFTWPKVLGYADDITVVTTNTHESVNEIFFENQRLTQASGLQLNADKTEKFNITGVLRDNVVTQNYVMYNGAAYVVTAQESIKINGIYYDLNEGRMTGQNFANMTDKMSRHFAEWSKRSLSLLGKIQIVKTFGISQYLYAMAVTDLTTKQWDEVNKLLYKFLWNKDFHARAAPHRIKKTIVTTSKEMGGFGMVDMQEIVAASRLRRFSLLQTLKHHPVEQLQKALGGYEYMRPLPKHNIDKITSTIMATLTKNVWNHQLNMRPGLDEADLVLHRQLLHCRLRWAVRLDRFASIEYNILRARGRRKISDVIPHANEVAMLGRIVQPQLRQIVNMLAAEYNGIAIPEEEVTIRIYNANQARWIMPSIVSSSSVRKFLNSQMCITNFKLLDMDADTAAKLLNKINRIVNIPNKTKLLRLLHGDVYCGTRLVKFGLSEIDQCIRCFQTETIRHLLIDCPYSKMVWQAIGVDSTTVSDILDADISQSELEVRAEVINLLVFRKGNLPPDILVKITLQAYVNKLCYKPSTINYAKRALGVT
jgi:hypothetical protein